MKPRPKEEWEQSPEYKAIHGCTIVGGADGRALPYLIKGILASERKRILERINELGKIPNSGFKNIYITRKEFNKLKKELE